jgi:small subunit ribosomal protein S17
MSQTKDKLPPTRGQSKVMVGTVLRAAMDKTVVVEILRRTKHPLYKKVVRRKKRYLVHDENNECGVGDQVEVMHTRPLSKLKRWRVSKVLAKAA